MKMSRMQVIPLPHPLLDTILLIVVEGLVGKMRRLMLVEEELIVKKDGRANLQILQRVLQNNKQKGILNKKVLSI